MSGMPGGIQWVLCAVLAAVGTAASASAQITDLPVLTPVLLRSARPLCTQRLGELFPHSIGSPKRKARCLYDDEAERLTTRTRMIPCGIHNRLSRVRLSSAVRVPPSYTPSPKLRRGKPDAGVIDK